MNHRFKRKTVKSSKAAEEKWQDWVNMMIKKADNEQKMALSV